MNSEKNKTKNSIDEEEKEKVETVMERKRDIKITIKRIRAAP